MPLRATIKKVSHRFHVWVGYGCAAFFIVLGLTGALLVFEEEISSALHPGWHVLPAPDTAQTPLPLDEVEKKVRARFPDHQLAGFRLPQTANQSLQVSLMREGVFSTVFIDPASGAILGHSSPAWRRIVLKMHNELVLGQWGAALLFFVACAMVLMGCSGLWMQRKLLRKLFRRPRFRRSPRLGFTDLHKMTGVPAFVFLFVIGTTGALYNFPAFEKIAAGKAGGPGFQTAHRHHDAAGISMDRAMRDARAAIPDLTPNYLSFPKNGNAKVGVYGSVPGQEFFGPYASSITLDAATGEVLSVKDLRTQPWSKKWRAFIRPLHHGNFGGLGVKTIYCLGALSLVVLTVTGLFIRRHRRKGNGKPEKGNG